mmetsp:Transcript_60107/g.127346  ORF Transcript_60107/g.127346 Transcript_60107/m.127346 type:complete len:225 (+) Transcript_60107:547-1221(+)|eukprot:CAMPEP_0206428010 /NCGR_PEP_ID=MMETSP0324_2-20121206/5393_1 /ASSEMBLY_ACC=CAM_ASM_000836 /TAXON_ID=2866 /ORGANISM="Crypthecodinium cohnii, Strain Seligo" /LENGTH=224 /DNA_ID=CAMNT_0053893423 /DNA_START=492 /DNA_END=1166 /DNA_ORIENTATION=-
MAPREFEERRWRSSSLSALPDEVIISILEAYNERCQLRSVANQIRRLVDRNFQIRHFEPPRNQTFSIDFEINQPMTKHLYCAKFGGSSAGDSGGVAGAVTFVNWIPAYYRSAPNAHRNVKHKLEERDACALWRYLAKVRSNRSETPSPPPSPPEMQPVRLTPWAVQQPPKAGHLTITDGECNATREVVGMLSPIQTEEILAVLDHRRNSGAHPLMGMPEVVLSN